MSKEKTIKITFELIKDISPNELRYILSKNKCEFEWLLIDRITPELFKQEISSILLFYKIKKEVNYDSQELNILFTQYIEDGSYGHSLDDLMKYNRIIERDESKIIIHNCVDPNKLLKKACDEYHQHIVRALLNDYQYEQTFINELLLESMKNKQCFIPEYLIEKIEIDESDIWKTYLKWHLGLRTFFK